MKYLLYPFTIAILLFFSCDETEKKHSESEIPNELVEKTVSDAVSDKDNQSNKVEKTTKLKAGKELRLKLLLDSFEECRKNSTNRTDCRHWASRIICEYGAIDDFKDEQGNYYYFDSIRPIILRSSNWERVGVINSQEVADIAFELTRRGKITLAIDTTVPYGLVTLLIPGEKVHSSSWNIDVPKCVYMNHTKTGDAFVDKPLSYAYKSPNGIVVYSREK